MAGAENWLGINLGDILAQTEQIKNAQQTRAYNALKIQQEQQAAADEAAKRDAYRQLFTPPTPTAGDVTGAANFATTGYNPAGLQALGEVDPEARLKLQEHFSKMSADQRELEGKKYIAAAPLAIKASKMPYETRKSFIAAASPYLQSQGWTPQEIAAFDPTDQNIQALGTIAMTVPQVLDSMKTEWHQIGDQGSFATDSLGNPIGSGNPFAASAVGGPGAAPAAPAAGGGFDAAVATSLHNEGGYNPRDMNGAPTNMGINLKANPLSGLAKYGVTDFSKMTPDQAKQIYHDRYWVPSGAESLPANMQTPYFDVYIRSPGFARQALAQSGGDPQKFMQLASAHFQGLAAKPGSGGAPYAKAWATRDANNTAIATGGGQALPNGLPTQAAPGYIPGVQKANQQYTPISEADRKQMGLPPGIYQRSPQGKVEPVSGSQTVELDAQGLDYTAAEYMRTGHMPPLGMKGGETRAQIIGRAAQLARDAGLSPDQAAGLHADFRANATALAALSRQANAVLAFESTASRNADQVLATMGKGEAGTGVPILNAWVQASRRGVQGSPDVARFDTAIKGFSSEYAKVLTSNGATGNVTDAAQAETQKLINAAQNPAQLRAVVQQAKIEMDNRKAGFADQIGALRQQLGAQKPTPQDGGIPTMTPEQARNAPSGTMFRTTDGRVMRKR